MSFKSSINPIDELKVNPKGFPKVYLLFSIHFILLLIPLRGNAQCTPPINIPVSDMILWLCPDSGVFNSSSNPASIGEDVYEWHDISGNNWIFENTRNSNRPVLDTNGGNSYLNFTPGDFLENSAISDSLNGLNEFSIFFVLKSNVTNTDNGVLFYRYPPNGADEGLCLRYDAAGANTSRSNVIKSGFLGNTPGNQIETTNNTQTTDRQTLSIKWRDGGKLYSYINGIPNDSSDNNVNGPLNSISEILIGKGAKDNGASRGWDGYIGTVIFYRNQYSDDTIRDISNALPIELVSFNAELISDVVRLDWTTASETNNNYFTIEKTKDGNSYETVAVVNGAGNSNSRLEYSVIDRKPYSGTSYYRLKQTDFDGSFDYSEHVAVNFRKENAFEIFPNPLKGRTLNLKMNAISEKRMQIQIINALGAEVYSTSIVQDEEMNPIGLQLPNNISEGIYYLIGKNNSEVFQQKLVIK